MTVTSVVDAVVRRDALSAGRRQDLEYVEDGELAGDRWVRTHEQG
jgi:hypothetical protein